MFPSSRSCPSYQVLYLDESERAGHHAVGGVIVPADSIARVEATWNAHKAKIGLVPGEELKSTPRGEPPMKLFKSPVDDDQNTAGDADDGPHLTLAAPDPAPISLVTLAAELGEPVDRLAKRINDDVFVEDRSGLRCVTVETCRRVLDERDARLAARRAEYVAGRSARAGRPRRPLDVPAADAPPANAPALAQMKAASFDAMPWGGNQGEWIGRPR